MGGVYKIVCLANRQVYLGAAKDVQGQLRVERDMLMRNRHNNQALQLAWNRFGNRHFTFDVIARVEDDELDVRLGEYVGVFRDRGVVLFNVEGEVGVRVVDRSKVGLKISNALIWKAKMMSEEERKELWGRGMRGKVLSEEHRKKVSEGMVGGRKSIETRRRMSVAQKESFRVDEGRRAGVAEIGRRNKGRIPANVVGYEIDGIEYESGSSACRELGLTPYELHKMIRYGRARRKD